MKTLASTTCKDKFRDSFDRLLNKRGRAPITDYVYQSVILWGSSGRYLRNLRDHSGTLPATT